MKAKEFIIEGVAGAQKCWPGHRKVGTQPGTGKNAGKPVNKCKKIGEDTDVDEAVTLDRSKNPSYPNDPATVKHRLATAKAILSNPNSDSDSRRAAAAIIAKSTEGVTEGEPKTVAKTWDQMTPKEKSSGVKGRTAWNEKTKKYFTVFDVPATVPEKSVDEGLTPDAMFDIIEEMVDQLASEHGVDPEVIWEDFESVDDVELLDESAAWRRSAGKNKKGGLNAKGVASYRRENPGSKLQTAVTTKPSKLKKGSKAAKRRKSFCARMGGVKGPMKKPNGKPTRKALALRKWNC